MSIQNSTGLVAGTPIYAQASGGDMAITCTSLSAGSSRQGTKSVTLLQIPPGLASAIMPEVLEIDFQVQMTSAPTAGDEVELYLGFSSSATAGTDNQGGLSGTDAALGNADQLPQLVFCGSIVLSNNLGTGVQSVRVKVAPQDAYLIPVVHNASATAFDGTAGHTIIKITPWYRAGLN